MSQQKANLVRELVCEMQSLSHSDPSSLWSSVLQCLTFSLPCFFLFLKKIVLRPLP